MKPVALSAALPLIAAPLVASAASQRAPSDVVWNVKSKVSADLTCRGQQDVAMLGRSRKSGFVVMIKPAGAKRPIYLVIDPRERRFEDVSLQVESLESSRFRGMEAELRALAPGLEPSPTCKGLSLEGDEKDANHIYWNRRAKTFQWWSL